MPGSYCWLKTLLPLCSYSWVQMGVGHGPARLQRKHTLPGGWGGVMPSPQTLPECPLRTAAFPSASRGRVAAHLLGRLGTNDLLCSGFFMGMLAGN